MDNPSIVSFEMQGAQYVQMMRQDYDAMLEHIAMLEDVHAVRSAKSQSHPTFSAEVVKRLVEGEHPVKIFRKYHKGYTQKTLAEQVGISRIYLCDIECGKKLGSLDVLKRIAAALDVGLEDIV